MTDLISIRSSAIDVFLFLLIFRFLCVCQGDAASSVWCPDGRFPIEDGSCQICYEYCGRSGCTGPSAMVGAGGCKTCWKGLELNSTHTKCILPYLPGCLTGYYLYNVPVHSSLPLAGAKVCRRCNELCETCSGPGVSYCTQCKFYKLHRICVKKCPSNTTADDQSRTCIITGDPQETMIEYIYNTRGNRTSNSN